MDIKDMSNKNRSKPPVPEVSLMMQRQQEEYQAAIKHSAQKIEEARVMKEEKARVESKPPVEPEPVPVPVEPEKSPLLDMEEGPIDATEDKGEKQP